MNVCVWQDLLETLAEMERKVLLVPVDPAVIQERWGGQVTFNDQESSLSKGIN